MKKHSFKSWVVATRPWSFPASAMPVLVTLTYLFWSGADVNWLMGIWAILTIVVVHAAGNTWSDYNDYVKGVDRKDTIGGLSITSGEFEPGEIKRLSLWLMAVSSLSGIAIVAVAGLPVLYVGLAGVALTLFYPWLKYRALGDLDIFLTYGVLPMVGTSFVAIGELEPNVALLCVPVGFITVGILHANNMRDTVQDRRANIKTVAMNLGGKTSAVLYGVEVLLPFGAVVAGVVAGLFPVTALFVLVAVKMAWSNFSMALKYPEQGMEAVKGLDERTAQLQLAFSVLLSISLVIAGFLKDNPMW